MLIVDCYYYIISRGIFIEFFFLSFEIRIELCWFKIFKIEIWNLNILEFKIIMLVFKKKILRFWILV